MLEDYEKKRRKQVSFIRSIMDYVMGAVMIGLGALLFFHDKLKIPINERWSPKVVKTLGVIVLLYGAWRIYKGYKKNYFQ
jgi:threonine/homoserine/homoserine lactone efflux protein